jgi:regulator of protease activity HflC (stomatin/prohibitin superfamily)
MIGTTLIAFILLLGLILAHVRVVPENQRVAIIRVGQLIGLRGPGIVFLVPYVEKAIRVDLDRDIPDWRSLPEELLLEKIRLRIVPE